jgi:hypothetical protein
MRRVCVCVCVCVCARARVPYMCAIHTYTYKHRTDVRMHLGSSYIDKQTERRTVLSCCRMCSLTVECVLFTERRTVLTSIQCVCRCMYMYVRTCRDACVYTEIACIYHLHVYTQITRHTYIHTHTHSSYIDICTHVHILHTHSHTHVLQKNKKSVYTCIRTLYLASSSSIPNGSNTFYSKRTHSIVREHIL